MKRYGLVRSQVYTRINALKAKNPELAPFKIGVKSYVNLAVLGCLDEMHRLISEEELTTEEAAEQVAGSTETRIEPANKAPDKVTIQKTDLSGVGMAIEKTASASLRTMAIEEPLSKYRALDEIAASGWQLPTSEIAALLGVQSLNGKQFERYGFRFIRAGKAGSESTWKVEKL